jgi:putative effector of murein hydrolase
MQSEDERGKRSAGIQTVLICVVVELMLLFFLRVILGSFAEAALTSLVVFGPASLWFAAPLYRHLLRANQ